MDNLTRAPSRAILDHAIADLRTAANGTGQITTIAAGITTVWPLDDAEHAVLTAVGFCWRDDRTALLIDTSDGPRALLLTPAPTRTSRGRAVAAFEAAVPGLVHNLSPSQKVGVDGAYRAGMARAMEIADAVGARSCGARSVAAVIRAELDGVAPAPGLDRPGERFVMIGGVGGWVCDHPVPGRPDGICGEPVETEPCPEHGTEESE